MPSLRYKSDLVQKITIIKYLLQQKGGIEKRFQNYLEEFLRRGFIITVLYGSEKDSYQRLPKVNYIKVNVGLMPSRKWRKVTFAKRVEKILDGEEYRDQIKLSMGRTGKADIVIAAGNYPEASKEDITNSSWLRKPMYFLDKNSFENSGLILAASHQVKLELNHLFAISDERVKVLYPPLKTADYYQISEERRKELLQQYAMNPSKNNFLFISTGHKRKGLPFLLNIFSKLNPDQYELFVAGNKFETKLSNVRSLGFIQNTNELYNIADCLLHPASYEAFGQVVTESLVCGTPVFVSDRVGAKEIVKNESGKVLAFNDEQSWIEAIESFDKKTKVAKSPLVGELGVQQHVDKMLSSWSLYQNKSSK